MNINIKYSKFDGLVISGGSIKGIYFLGALKSLEENGIIKNIKFYGGTSIGAIISILCMIGYTSLEIFSFICTTNILEIMCNQHMYANIFNLLTYYGIYDFDNIKDELEKLIKNKIGYIPTLWKLEKITKKKFFCVTYNLSTKNTIYITSRNFPNINILDALHMTSNLPVMFDKYKYKDSVYIDGGFSDNFPIKYMKYFISKNNFFNKEDIHNKNIIALNLYKNDNIIYKHVLEYFFDIILSVPYINIENGDIKGIKVIELKDELNLKIYDLNASFSKKVECFSSGYKQMENIINKKIKKD